MTFGASTPWWRSRYRAYLGRDSLPVLLAFENIAIPLLAAVPHHHQPSLTKKLCNITFDTITEIAKIPAIQDHRVNQEKVLRHRDCWCQLAVACCSCYSPPAQEVHHLRLLHCMYCATDCCCCAIIYNWTKRPERQSVDDAIHHLLKRCSRDNIVLQIAFLYVAITRSSKNLPQENRSRTHITRPIY